MGVDVAGHDADLAAGVGVGVCAAVAGAGFGAGGDDAGAVGADEGDLFIGGCGVVHLVEDGADLDHVLDGDALGDGADEFEVGRGGFEDRIAGEGGGDEDHGGVGTCGLYGGFDGVEDGEAVGVLCAALAGGYAADHFGAVVEASLGVDGSEGAGDALTDDACGAVDEDCHGGRG